MALLLLLLLLVSAEDSPSRLLVRVHVNYHMQDTEEKPRIRMVCSI
jgi:hypothetical protein